MFRVLGQYSSRYWPVVLAAWVMVMAGVHAAAPRFNTVVDDGEFKYIPDEFDSRRGEELFKSSFSRDMLGSSVVMVLRRENNREGLLPRDRRFIRDVLKPRLERIRQRVKVPADESETGRDEPVITRIRTLDDPAIGELLVSEDGKATLVILELRTELFVARNRDVIDRVEELVAREGPLRTDASADKRIPVGLDVTVSGTATVGRDMRLAAEESASSTHLTTMILVVLLLLLIYRAPLLVLIPVATVVVSVTLALDLLAMMASAGIVQLFSGIEIYVQVVMYGAGIDYCMFLMARYKEELDGGAAFDEAAETSVRRVGSALAASAGTTMAGIGMMVFAQFGKFQQAGVAMSFSLFFVLAASLTFAPAMLRLFGKWAFWPQVPSERIVRAGGWLSPTTLIARLMQSGAFRGVWEKIGRQLRERPATIFLASIALMLPLAVVGALYHDHLSFGLLSELDDDEPSVIGAKAVQQHFPAGATGPVSVLLESDHLTFARGDGDRRAPTEDGMAAIRKLTRRLSAQRERLGIADIRSLAEPLGITNAATRAEEAERRRMMRDRERQRKEQWDRRLSEREKEREQEWDNRAPQRERALEKERVARGVPKTGLKFGLFLRNFNREYRERFDKEFDRQYRARFDRDFDREYRRQYERAKRQETLDYYVSDRGPLAGRVTRIDIVFDRDAFSRDAMNRFDEARATVRRDLPDELRRGTDLYFIGSTASIRDMKSVTNQDQVRIDVLVILGVFVVLVILLRKPAISAYLIVSVFFSYLCTLGATFVVFYSLDPAGFAGLDWKVPIFLFTILIAVGEDYNIYLITRIEEEQADRGPLGGITSALSKTGGIISGCGIIMAGTFSSLLAGSLAGMHQLGFALAFGVLLDTFVVRPILVPAYLMLLHGGRFGAVGRLLGAQTSLPAAQPAWKVLGGGSAETSVSTNPQGEPGTPS